MRTNPAARRSITSHPLFPVIVVLWCGALFGMASLAIRTETIESAVVAWGIDGVVPMAAPPLGKTARVLIALLATGLGCLIGLLVMRRVSKPQAEAPVRRRRSSASVEEAASPVSLFGGDPIEDAADADPVIEQAEPAPTGRRRRFSLGREEQVQAADPAPVPGAQIFNVAELDLDSFEPDADTPRWVRNIHRDEPEAAAPEPAPSRNALFDSYVRRAMPDASSDDTIAKPGFELLSRKDESAEEEADAPAALVATPALASEPRPRPQGSAAERIATAPLDDLSPVELLERLALTIERRRAAARAAAQAAEEAAAAEPEIDALPAQPETDAMSQPLPAAMRPVDLHEQAHDDEPLPGYVPPRHIGLKAPLLESGTPALSNSDDDEDEDVLAEGYSSLRNLSRPAVSAAAPQPLFGASAARFARPADREGRSVFPFRAQPESHVETSSEADQQPRAFDAPVSQTRDKEAELREALATLQRMSGAA